MSAKTITGDAEALTVAAALADEFRAEASRRDAERRLPREELDRLSGSGLLAVTVPAEHGGADVRQETLAEIFRLLASADASLAQIPQSHFVYVNVIHRQGTAEQRKFFFGEVLAGRRFGNAQSEAGTKHVQDIRTRLESAADGSYVLTGVKHYSTGALFADWIPVLARAEGDNLHVAYVPRDAEGLTVVDDWDGMGQRTTASGTVRLDAVLVPADRVLPHHLTFRGPQLHGAVAQLLHAAIDAGIAAGALVEAAEFVRTKSRPWFEWCRDRRRGSAAHPALRRAGHSGPGHRGAARRGGPGGRHGPRRPHRGVGGRGVHRRGRREGARREHRRRGVGRALRGVRHPVRPQLLNLHRHWRDARTHTLHDPARWKIQHIGRYVLNGTPPPRHGLL